MDIISHALWSVTIVREKRLWGWAIFFGILPDIISTGVGIFYLFLKNGFFLKENWWLNLPNWSKSLYFLSHSLFGFLILFFIIFLFKKKFLVLTLPFGFHSLVDLLTHQNDPLFRIFYPLFEYKEERVIGFNWWENFWIFFINIFLIILVNVLFLKIKKNNLA